MPHAQTIACVGKAKALLEKGDADSLRYASIEVRMAIEYLFYELVPLYKDELPDDILKAWQPQKILDAILECDPDADQDGKYTLAEAGRLGQPDAPHLVLESKAPNKALIKKHYHRIASYLHAPTNLVEPDLATWKSDLENAIAVLEQYKHGQALSNIRELVTTECICGRAISRNKQGIVANRFVQCHDPKCRAIFDAHFEDDETFFTLREEWYHCPYCDTRNGYKAPTIKDGMVLKCVECGKRVVARQSYRIDPIDNLKEIVEAAKAGKLTDAQELDFYIEVGNRLCKKVNEALKASPTEKAISRLMGRLVQSGNTIRALFDQPSEHKWVWDGVSILRTSFDAMLQAMYILHDPKESDKLATRFLEFGIVEQVKLIRVFDNRATTFSRRFASSPRRAEVESEIMDEYKRVCDKYDLDFQRPHRNKNWYEGNLDTVADKTGYRAEYDIVQKQLSAVVHSSVFGLDSEYLTPMQVARFQWDFAFRLLGRYAAYAGVKLDETESKLVKEANRNIYDNPALEPSPLESP